MLLSQNGLAAFTRRGFHGALFSALLAFALFDSEAASAQEMKQIKLTEKYIQDFMAAANEDATSAYYHRLDLTKISAAGHSQGSGGASRTRMAPTVPPPSGCGPVAIPRAAARSR